jgi:heme o synthase
MTVTAELVAQTRQFLALCKLRIVALIVFTAVVGMALATPGMIPLDALFAGSLGIGLAAASAAAVNHLLDERADRVMTRTRHRPLPSNRLGKPQVIGFASALAVVSMALLFAFVNTLTAVLTFAGLIGYAIDLHRLAQARHAAEHRHRRCRRRHTTGAGLDRRDRRDPCHALILFLIVFVWTPPHFWALAIHRRDDYAAANVPMMPVTHGVEFTRWQILFYTIILVLVTLLPWLTGMSGLAYLAGATVLNIGFLGYAIALMKSDDEQLSMQMFHYSVVYLMALFAFLLSTITCSIPPRVIT